MVHADCSGRVHRFMVTHYGNFGNPAKEGIGEITFRQEILYQEHTLFL